jgi:hypothetical protein
VRQLVGYLLVAGAAIAAVVTGIWTSVEAFRAETEIHSVSGLAQSVWALGGPTFVGAFVVGMVGVGLLRLPPQTQ